MFLSECATAADANDAGRGPKLAAQPFIVTNQSRTGSGTFTVEAGASAKPYDMSQLLPCTTGCVLVATSGVGVAAAFADHPLKLAPTSTLTP